MAILLRTAVCAYRAATQSIVHDEAFTFSSFIAGSWRDLYFHYNANNHVLYSIAAKLSLVAFGDSEFTLRLPSVVAGFFMMVGVWLVLNTVESRLVRWIAFSAIGLHPLLLDFSVAARGYGMALAFLTLALWAAIERRTVLTGILCGFAISANLTTAFFAAGIIATYFAVSKGGLAQRLRVAIEISLPAAMITSAICWSVFTNPDRNLFYAGLNDWRDSMGNVVWSSISGSSRHGLFASPTIAISIAFGLIPIFLVFFIVCAYRAWRDENLGALLPIGCFGFACAAWSAAHLSIGIPFPIDRTGLGFMLMFPLAWAASAGLFRVRALHCVTVAIALAFVAQFATQFHVTYFVPWLYDRSTKQIALLIQAQTIESPADSISIGATWIHQPALEYYRTHQHLSAWKPVERRDPSVIQGQNLLVLNAQDPNFHSARTILFADPLAGVVLARGER